MGFHTGYLVTHFGLYPGFNNMNSFKVRYAYLLQFRIFEVTYYLFYAFKIQDAKGTILKVSEKAKNL